MNKKVVITGIGIISAIGKNTDEVLQSLKEKKSGVGDIDYVDTIHKGVIPVAGVKYSNEELAELCNINDLTCTTRTTLLGIKAAQEAVENSKISKEILKKTGFISATSVGGMDRSEEFFKKYLENQNSGDIKNIVTHDCADSTERIAKNLGLSGYISTISTACSSSVNSVMTGARMIKNGILDSILTGGVDSLTMFTINGFNTLMILDKEMCRPFDDTRTGLNLGEAAGFLMLESEEHALARGAEILCEVKGYGNACDAYHQTASSPDGHGPCLAMKKAVDTAGINPADIDYINVHGTGTQNNDLSEGKALQKLFDNKVPKFSSTKAYTGHTLGAAGAVEIIISALSVKNKMIFPNLNFSTKMKELDLIPETELIENIELNNVLSNSFGFGGNDSSIIVSKYK